MNNLYRTEYNKNMIEFVIPCSGELCEARTLEDARKYFALFNYTAEELAEVCKSPAS